MDGTMTTWTAHAQAAMVAEQAGHWREAMTSWREAMHAAPDPALGAYAFDRYYAAYYREQHATNPRWPWGPRAPDPLPRQSQ